MNQLFKKLEVIDVEKLTDNSVILEFFISNVMKKKAIVFMLSDFMDDDYEKTLKIVGRKHDITGIRVYDKHDVEIPNLGIVPMLDAETQQVHLVNTGSKIIRKWYLEVNMGSCAYKRRKQGVFAF